MLNGSVKDLDPGESFDLTIGFTPKSFMDYEIQLVVESNDPDEPKARADTIGHGSEWTCCCTADVQERKWTTYIGTAKGKCF